MKGVPLAGGAGTRLDPVAGVVGKHLLPVYGRPVIGYPLALLMLTDILEAHVVSTPQDMPRSEEIARAKDSTDPAQLVRPAESDESRDDGQELRRQRIDGVPAP